MKAQDLHILRYLQPEMFHPISVFLWSSLTVMCEASA